MPRLRCSSRSTQVKKTQKSFCLLVVAEMFREVALFLETSSVLKTSWVQAWLTTMTGWQIKTFGKSIFQSVKSFYFFKVYLHSHDAYNLHTQMYFNSNTNVHIYLLTISK